MTAKVERLTREFPDPPAVWGFLHRPDKASGDALVLTHGAGGNCQAPLLVAIADELSQAGMTVLRCDLPYRQRRPKGPPSPATAAQDREGLRRAVATVREHASGRVLLGGQSYGGRQATLLAAEEPQFVDGLLLISYPLHPPGRPENLRTEHFPKLRTPALFLHGSQDAFGTFDEMRQAFKLLPARHEMVEIEGGGHGLVSSRAGQPAIRAMAERVRESLENFLG